MSYSTVRRAAPPTPGVANRERPVKSAYRFLHGGRVPARALDRARRRRLLMRVRLDAFWHRAVVRMVIAPDVRMGRDVRITVVPRTSSELSVGSGSLLGEGVRIRLEGGRLLVGEHSELRRNVSLVVGGVLRLDGRNLLQAGCSLHCARSVTVGARAVLSEYTTVVDSAHHYTTPEQWFLDNVKTGPVEIGADTWIGAKATISRGVTVGDHAIVAANSLVTRDVPAGQLASGVPAEVSRPVDLPWTTAPTPPAGAPEASEEGG